MKTTKKINSSQEIIDIIENLEDPFDIEITHEDIDRDYFFLGEALRKIYKIASNDDNIPIGVDVFSKEYSNFKGKMDIEDAIEANKVIDAIYCILLY